MKWAVKIVSRFTRPVFGHLIASTCCLQDFQVLPNAQWLRLYWSWKWEFLIGSQSQLVYIVTSRPLPDKFQSYQIRKIVSIFNPKLNSKSKTEWITMTIEIVTRFYGVYYLVKSRENLNLTKNFEFPALLRTGLLPSKSADTSKTPNNKIKNFSRILTNRKNIVIFLKQASKAIKSLKFCIVFYMF